MNLIQQVKFKKRNLAYNIVKEIAYHNRLTLPWNVSQTTTVFILFFIIIYLFLLFLKLEVSNEK
jgi:hypothetical protein